MATFFEQAYETWNRDGRIPPNVLANDFVVHQTSEILGTVGAFHGQDALERTTDELREAFGEITFIPERVFETPGGVVVIFVRFAGHGRGSGVDVNAPIAHVVTVRAGKATQFDVYWERTLALAAIGLGVRSSS